MSPNSGLNRQAFEAFLANAFAVQKSGLDSQSLSAVMEVQQFIATGKPNIDRALSLIADRSLKVSNASGVAIARLESNQLIYCAATGSAAKEMGRRLPAVFSLCSQSDGKTEILRVENAHNDSRIQAEICRQFGAASLLILPIYHHHVVTGVLQVHFNEAHSFLDREVRAYRLMAGLAADAISGTVEHIQAEAAVTLAGTADVIQRHISPGQAFSDNDRRSWQDIPAPTRHDLTLEVEKLVRIGTAAAKQWAQPARGFLANHVWEWQTIGAVIVLVIVLGIAHFHHPAPTTLGLTTPSADTREKFPDNPLPVSDHWKSLDHGAKDEMAPNTAFRKVRIGPNEVDYIAEDVTIRYFMNSKTRPQPNVKLLNIGDDVTVRYFSSESAVTSEATPLSTTTTTK